MGYGCGPGWGFRRYLTRDERIDWLEGYSKHLESELQGVRERIAELKGKPQEA